MTVDWSLNIQTHNLFGKVSKLSENINTRGIHRNLNFKPESFNQG